MLESPKASREEIEDFFYTEAAFLDEWRLEEWLELLTEDVTYEVPATDEPSGQAGQQLLLVADDSALLRERVKELMGTYTWVEMPRSRTRRFITNVRVERIDRQDVHVCANFLIYRLRNDITATYVGHYENILRRENGKLKLHRRRSVLDNESLRHHGAIAFIL